MTDIAIKAEHLSKVYKIYERDIDRLKETFNPFHKRYSRDFYALKDCRSRFAAAKMSDSSARTAPANLHFSSSSQAFLHLLPYQYKSMGALPHCSNSALASIPN